MIKRSFKFHPYRYRRPRFCNRFKNVNNKWLTPLFVPLCLFPFVCSPLFVPLCLFPFVCSPLFVQTPLFVQLGFQLGAGFVGN